MVKKVNIRYNTWTTIEIKSANVKTLIKSISQIVTKYLLLHDLYATMP